MRLLSRWLLVAVMILGAGLAARSVRALAAFPTITISSGAVAPGGTAFVSGMNFKGNESVTIYLLGGRVQSGLVSPAGSFNLSFVAPLTTPPGNDSVQAQGASGDSAWAFLDVSGGTPTPTATPPRGATPTPTPSPSPTSPAGGSNLLQNGGFESGIAPWSAYHALLALTSPGHSGASALRATPWAPGSGLYYIVDYAGDNPWGVLPYGIPAPSAGTYQATAWVTGVPGRTIQLCVRDGTASTIGGMDCAGVTATGAWQQLSVNHHVASAGVNLDVWIGGYHYQSGDAFMLDDVALLAP